MGGWLDNQQYELSFICSEEFEQSFICSEEFEQSRELARNLEIGKQFPDSENAQYNLEIAQIPRLHVQICTETDGFNPQETIAWTGKGCVYYTMAQGREHIQ